MHSGRRRRILKLLMRYLIFLTCLLLTLRASDAAERPHIILFISDDHTARDCGPYGAPDVRTPNLDQLAKDGMRFDAAFAASPTCTPSRSSLYTGLYPFRSGAHANHSLINENLRTLPHYFKDLGYRVVLAGKTHIGPRSSFPFEYLPDSNVMPPGKDHVLWTDLNTAPVDQLLSTHDRATPLLLIVASHSPHVFWPENEGYDPSKLQLTPDFLDTPKTREERCRYYSDVTHMDAQLGEVRASVRKHGYDDALFIYTSDHGAQWPFAKWNLYDAGIRVPLIVSWQDRVKADSSTRALVSLVDLLPTLLEVAGGARPSDLDGRSFLGVVTGELDKHHDAVFASHTGDGKMNRSPMRCVRTGRYKYILNLKPDDELRTHISHGDGPDRKGYWESWLRLADTDPRAAAMIQRFRRRPAEELYDASNDPFEQKNLAADPARADTLASLREKLKSWRVAQGEDLAKVPMPEDARKGDIPYAK